MKTLKSVKAETKDEVTQKKLVSHYFYDNLTGIIKFVVSSIVWIAAAIVSFNVFFVPLKSNEAEIAHLKEIAADVYEQKVDGVTLIYVPDGYSFEFTDTTLEVKSQKYQGSVTLRLKIKEITPVDRNDSSELEQFTLTVDDGLAYSIFISIGVGLLLALIVFLAIYLKENYLL